MPDQPDNDEMTGLVVERRAADVICRVDFSRLSILFPITIFIDKLTKYGLDKWTVD